MMALSMPGGMEWIILLLIIVVIFGAGKLRNIGKDLGGAIRDFKTSLKEGEEEEEKKNDTASKSGAAPHDSQSGA